MSDAVLKFPGGVRPRIVPEPPAHVTGLAAEEWRRVVAVLVERGDMDEAILGTLESYAVHYQRWRLSEDHVREYGLMVEAPRTGVPMENPHVSIANKTASMTLRLAKALQILP
jgi:P27 family predicted phage terminase small subunit